MYLDDYFLVREGVKQQMETLWMRDKPETTWELLGLWADMSMWWSMRLWLLTLPGSVLTMGDHHGATVPYGTRGIIHGFVDPELVIYP